MLSKLHYRARALLRNLMEKRTAESGNLVRLGSAYGGWWVPREALRAGALCYSGGVGEDATFDRALAEQYGVVVHAFDPTPRAASYVTRDMADVRGFHFHPIGLWSATKTLRFYAPADPAHVSHSVVNLQGTTSYFEATCHSVPEIMKTHGHAVIDLLKLDIEGAEHEVIAHTLSSGVRPAVLCFEIDQPAAIHRIVRTAYRVSRNGYQLVKVDGWNFTFVRTRP